MHYTTKKKIEFLQAYLIDKLDAWSSIDKLNITGFRIDKKNGCGHYAIIFHVARKRDKNKLTDAKTVPPHYDIKFPDGRTRRIRTDVEQTGKTSLQLSPCYKNLPDGRRSAGTMGIFVSDSFDNIYGITNYHVAAWEYLMQNITELDVRPDDNVWIGADRSTHILGRFSQELDVAFVRLATPARATNRLPTGLLITARAETGPITPAAIGQQLTIFSRLRPMGITGTIANNSVAFNTGLNNFFIRELIMIDRRITSSGDSGSPAMISDTLVGIVIGADVKYTYIIPYYKIHSYIPLPLIKT